MVYLAWYTSTLFAKSTEIFGRGLHTSKIFEIFTKKYLEEYEWLESHIAYQHNIWQRAVAAGILHCTPKPRQAWRWRWRRCWCWWYWPPPPSPPQSPAQVKEVECILYLRSPVINLIWIFFGLRSHNICHLQINWSRSFSSLLTTKDIRSKTWDGKRWSKITWNREYRPKITDHGPRSTEKNPS